MSLAAEFRQFIQAHGADKPADSQQHSGASHIHYGLSNPTMRGFVQDWALAHENLSLEDWQATLTDLYAGESVDEKCLAGFLLGHYATLRGQMPLAWLDGWLGQLEGWREIDTTCQSNFSAKEVFARWDDYAPFLRDLAERDTIQHRRASLVMLIRPLRESDDARIFELALQNVEMLKHERDKLITKAVSWVLRQAIKHHREAVGDYVARGKDTLPAIAAREFTKKYQTGRK